MKIRHPDPAAAALELQMAEGGDRDAARRILERVAMGAFDDPSVRAYLMRSAERILGRLEEASRNERSPKDINLSPALLLDGKQNTGVEGVEIAQDVLRRVAEGLTQRRAIYIVSAERGISEPEVKAKFYKYRNDQRAARAALSVAWNACTPEERQQLIEELKTLA